MRTRLTIEVAAEPGTLFDLSQDDADWLVGVPFLSEARPIAFTSKSESI